MDELNNTEFNEKRDFSETEYPFVPEKEATSIN